jgi:hypothetical protein
MPADEGGWTLSPNRAIIWENPVVIFTCVRTEAFLDALSRIREFVHGLGRETNQGEVVVWFERRFYRIRNFDTQIP